MYIFCETLIYHEVAVVGQGGQNGQGYSFPLQRKTDGEVKMVPLSKVGAQSDDEYVVERIVSRRYNIRKKAYEYLLKWEGYTE